MFEFLQGQVVRVQFGSVVIATGGIGWHLSISARSAELLEEGQEYSLYVHLAVSDSAMNLFGFVTHQERELFRRLLQVGGVGPTSALGILSALSPADFVAAVVQGDAARLTAVKGVGKKTAERLILELRESLQNFMVDAPSPSSSTTEIGESLIRVLSELGFRPQEARRAAESAQQQLGPTADFQELLRAALNENTQTA